MFNVKKGERMDFNEFDRGVFVVNVLGIVFDAENKKILIGKRENDPHIEKLSWCFPGGRPIYDEDLEHYLKLEIKKKTNLDIEIKNVVFAKTYPENRKFLSIYYLCEAKSGGEKAGESFSEIKWVKPEETKDYFTTSLHPKLEEYLNNL